MSCDPHADTASTWCGNNVPPGTGEFRADPRHPHLTRETVPFRSCAASALGRCLCRRDLDPTSPHTQQGSKTRTRPHSLTRLGFITRRSPWPSGKPRVTGHEAKALTPEKTAAGLACSVPCMGDFASFGQT